MARTWKHSPDQEEFQGGSILEHLEQELPIDFHLIEPRLRDLGIDVQIYEESDELRLLYGRFTACYFPRAGGVVVRERNPKSGITRVKFSNYNPTKRALKGGNYRRISLPKFFDDFLSANKLYNEGVIHCYDDDKHVSDAVPEIRPIILNVNDEIIKYLARHPTKIHDLSSRKFEELIADILRNFGFEVELTRATRDGGKDIVAYIRTQATAFLTYVECKKYAADHKVGVDVVREVYGVQRIYKANKSLIVTTSSFTRDAVEARRHIENEMDLKDLEDLKVWLQIYRH